MTGNLRPACSLPRTVTRLAATTVTAAVAAALAIGVAGSSPVQATRESLVDSTTIAVIATPRHVTVTPEVPIRLGPAQHTADLELFLAGTADTVRDEIIAVIDQARDELGSGALTTAFLIANVGTGCFPAEHVTVVRPGPSPTPRDVMVTATFPDDTNVSCVVALHSIAIVAVDIDDVPIGGADQAELVLFTQVDRDGSADVLARVRLAAPPAGHTQLAIEYTGCRDRAAELVITSAAIRAVGNQGDDTHGPLCAAPEYFLAVFELPDWAIPADAVVQGLVAEHLAQP